MANNSNIILTNLDFDTLKATFKEYLRSQENFKDYDFDGSNMSVLLDILSYNTFQNSFYLNMLSSEMFLDTAQLRDSIISHAKELNYVPRSFTSAVANVNISAFTSDLSKRTIVLPKGQQFTGRFASRTFIFSTNENIVLSDYTYNESSGLSTISANNISIYEGYYVTDSYVYSYAEPERLVITNPSVDTTSIAITVIEDSGATTLDYKLAPSLFNLTPKSQVFFLQGAENESYEIVFGDDVTGRRPKNNSIINIEYRITNGELPNGTKDFIPGSSFGANITRVDITTNEAAKGGSVSESIESIRYNAPRHFNTQERAITTEDYETLLKINFPEINTVSAFGGENLDPPQFGRVFIAVDLKEVDGLPEIKRDQYYKFIKPRSPVSIDPVFLSPAYTYLEVYSRVKYNVNVTRLTTEDVKMITSSAIINYAQTYLNDFNTTLRYSKLVEAIDNSQVSIVSNETDIRIIKVITPALGIVSSFDVAFKLPLDKTIASASGQYCINSTQFVYNNRKCILRDDGAGKLQIISVSTNDVVKDTGTVNYDTGLLQLANFSVQAFTGSGIKIYAVPRGKDISATADVILNIIPEDINIVVETVRV